MECKCVNLNSESGVKNMLQDERQTEEPVVM